MPLPRFEPRNSDLLLIADILRAHLKKKASSFTSGTKIRSYIEPFLAALLEVKWIWILFLYFEPQQKDDERQICTISGIKNVKSTSSSFFVPTGDGHCRYTTRSED